MNNRHHSALNNPLNSLRNIKQFIISPTPAYQLQPNWNTKRSRRSFRTPSSCIPILVQHQAPNI